MTDGGRWYEDAFRDHYLTVYAHRDEEAARREAEFAVEALGLEAGDPVLDLACGWGRHARALAGCDTSVTGVDLSLSLITRARAEGGGPAYLRGDMRALPFAGTFRAVLLFFTSFGYFRGDGDRRVLDEIARVLRPGGGLLLDYVNREQVMKGLVPESEREAEGIRIHERREISDDGLRVLKHVRVEAPDEAPFTYTESVRLYTPEEAVALLEAAGFSVAERHGDLSGSPFGSDSPRLVLVGRLAC